MQQIEYQATRLYSFESDRRDVVSLRVDQVIRHVSEQDLRNILTVCPAEPLADAAVKNGLFDWLVERSG